MSLVSNLVGKLFGGTGLIQISYTSDDKAGKFAASIKRMSEQKVLNLSRRIQSKLITKLSGTTNPAASYPGNYPSKINGHLINSISVNVVSKYNIVIKTEGSRAKRLAYLESGFTLPAKANGSYAVSVSAEARKASSNGLGPREAFGQLFFNKMSLTFFGRTKMFAVLSTKKGTSKNKRDIGTVHYVLSRGPLKIKARKGLNAFMIDEEKFMSEFLSSGWDKI